MHPDGIVREVIFPALSEQTLVKKWHATSPLSSRPVQAVIRSSYRSHDRRMLARLLQTLEFRSNNTLHRPLIHAPELLTQYAQSRVCT
jgi:hypothetical protein